MHVNIRCKCHSVLWSDCQSECKQSLQECNQSRTVENRTIFNVKDQKLDTFFLITNKELMQLHYWSEFDIFFFFLICLLSACKMFCLTGVPTQRSCHLVSQLCFCVNKGNVYCWALPREPMSQLGASTRTFHFFGPSLTVSSCDRPWKSVNRQVQESSSSSNR